MLRLHGFPPRRGLSKMALLPRALQKTASFRRPWILSADAVTGSKRPGPKAVGRIAPFLRPYSTAAKHATSFPPKPVPRKIDGYYSDRRQFPKSQWGVAASSNSSQFKQMPSEQMPKARRWDKIISAETNMRKGSSLKNAAKFLSNPGLISLGGGLPSSEYFPFEGMSLRVFSPASTTDKTLPQHSLLHVGKHDLADGEGIYDMATAFNYGSGSGSPQLLRWITEHTEIIHRPPYQDWACTMTVGSTSALDMTLRMLTQPGDAILSEEYTFATAVETGDPMGVKVVGVPMDEQGLLPGAMDDILSSWDQAARKVPKPKILYTVPSGQNPTGATQGFKRRQEIYRVAQKHDLYIIEDEPYYFLQMPAEVSEHVPVPESHDGFLQEIIPSILSMDTDGRVMRMDSFSKVLSPGLRLGWITASEQIVELYKIHAELSTQGPSGVSQLAAFKLLDEGWRHGGYLDWLMHIRMEYTKRRNAILGACEQHLPKDIVSWSTPRAGMFLWLRVDWKRHPDAPSKSLVQIEEEIFHEIINNGALAMRGSWFYAEPNANHDQMFFRVTFAAASFDNIHEAIRRFGVAIRKSFELERTKAPQ